jgi:tRNA pseudouridine55 synthase
VVCRVRKALQTRKVGHGGTLDPDATGVLIVAVGRATRLLRYLSGQSKTYTAEFVLGRSTTTLDSSGETTGAWDMSGVTLDAVRRAAEGLTGEILQVPPMVSALKVDGKRLHELARDGIEVEREPRPVSVHRLDVRSEVEPSVFAVEVECSAGTYVRSLAADLGTALGGGAHLRNLRRTASGWWTEADALALGDVGADHLRPVSDALRGMPVLPVDAAQARMVSHGRVLKSELVPGSEGDGPWQVVGPDKELLAVYRRSSPTEIRPEMVLG